MGKKTKRRFGGDGCGFLLMSCLVTCFFLIVNSVIVAAMFQWYHPRQDLQENDEIAQAVLFVAPVLMVFAEWWLVDFFADRRAKRREIAERKRGEAE